MLAYIGYYGGGAGWLILIPIALVLMRVFMRRRMGPPTGGPGPYGGRGSPYGSPFPGQGPSGHGPTADAPSTADPSASAPPRTTVEPSPGDVRIPAGWMHDPSGRYDLRYWSGTAWTEHVSRDGVPDVDPPPGAARQSSGTGQGGSAAGTTGQHGDREQGPGVGHAEADRAPGDSSPTTPGERHRRPEPMPAARRPPGSSQRAAPTGMVGSRFGQDAHTGSGPEAQEAPPEEGGTRAG